MGGVSGPIDSALKGLSSEQLIGVIQSIVQNHAELEEVILLDLF